MSGTLTFTNLTLVFGVPPSPPVGSIELEDGSGSIDLEDGSGEILLE